MTIMRVAVAVVFSAFFYLNPGPSAAAHPGNTASDGCHYCRTNCDEWGVAYDERHCHNGGDSGGGGGGSTDTTSPPDSSSSSSTTNPPRTTAPPSTETTSPPATSAPREDSTTSSTTTTTTVDSTPPEPAEVAVSPPEVGEAMTVVEIEGEPATSFEVTVESEPQVERGTLDEDGRAVVELLVDNGEHTATVMLVDDEGNASEPAVERFTVDLPPPEGAEYSVVTSSEGETIVVKVSGGPPQGSATVTAGDDEATTSLDEDGEGRVTLAPGDGEWALTGSVSDYQGQRSEEVAIETVTIGEVSDESGLGDTVGGLLTLLALGGGGLWYYRRRQEHRVVTMADDAASARRRSAALEPPTPSPEQQRAAPPPPPDDEPE